MIFHSQYLRKSDKAEFRWNPPNSVDFNYNKCSWYNRVISSTGCKGYFTTLSHIDTIYPWYQRRGRWYISYWRIWRFASKVAIITVCLHRSVFLRWNCFLQIRRCFALCVWFYRHINLDLWHLVAASLFSSPVRFECQWLRAKVVDYLWTDGTQLCMGVPKYKRFMINFVFSLCDHDFVYHYILVRWKSCMSYNSCMNVLVTEVRHIASVKIHVIRL